MRVKFLTLGCKVNQYETQALSEEFISRGCSLTNGIADIYVINTCTVTSRADSKSREAILKAKSANPKAKIVVSGCLAQLNREFIKKMKVDYIIPQEKKYSLVDIVLDGATDHKNIWSLRITKFYNHRAFIKIQDGCNNHCSFCKIPFVRGSSCSRGSDDILEEVKKVSFFHKEVVLCGVNIGLYGKDFNPPRTLTGLIKEIVKINSLHRLRLSSLEPSLVDEETIGLFYNNKLCPHLHFPFQSGDDMVLKRMNKKETVFLYEDIVNKIRKINPLFAISCDIIVGFPHEDEESFNNTIEFLKKVKPMRMHLFSFSPREKTPFFGIKKGNTSVTQRRYALLKKLAFDFSLEYRERFLGKILNMIVEEKKEGHLCGYTENYIKVYIKEKVPLGEAVHVRIKRVDKDKTFASIL